MMGARVGLACRRPGRLRSPRCGLVRFRECAAMVGMAGDANDPGCVAQPRPQAVISHQNRAVVVPVSLPMVSVTVAGFFVFKRLALAVTSKVYALPLVWVIFALMVKPLITPKNA